MRDPRCGARRGAGRSRIRAAQRLDAVREVREQLAALPRHGVRADLAVEAGAATLAADRVTVLADPVGIVAELDHTGTRRRPDLDRARREVRRRQEQRQRVDVARVAQRDPLGLEAVRRACDRDRRRRGQIAKRLGDVLDLGRDDEDVAVAPGDRLARVCAAGRATVLPEGRSSRSPALRIAASWAPRASIKTSRPASATSRRSRRRSRRRRGSRAASRDGNVAAMGKLDQPAFEAQLRDGCAACGGRVLEISSFIDRSVQLMLADVNGPGRWAHDGEKFVDGTYRITCVACKALAFESDICPRCHAPGGLARALGEPSRLAVPKRCPKLQRARVARGRARARGRASRRWRGAETQATRRIRRARLPCRGVRVRRVRSRDGRRGLSAMRRAGAAACQAVSFCDRRAPRGKIHG